MKYTTEVALSKVYFILSNLQEFMNSTTIDKGHALVQKHERAQKIFSALSNKFYGKTLSNESIQEKVGIVVALYEMLNIHRDIIQGRRDKTNKTLTLYNAAALKDDIGREYIKNLEPHILALHEIMRILLDDPDTVDEDSIQALFDQNHVNLAPGSAQVFELRMTVLGQYRWEENEYPIQRSAVKKASAGAVVANLAGAAMFGLPGLMVTVGATAFAAYRADKTNPTARERFWKLREAVNQPDDKLNTAWRNHAANMIINEDFNHMLCAFYDKKTVLKKSVN